MTPPRSPSPWPLWAVALGVIAAAGLTLSLFAAERLMELWRIS